jgi:hypothetical protein
VSGHRKTARVAFHMTGQILARLAALAVTGPDAPSREEVFCFCWPYARELAEAARRSRKTGKTRKVTSAVEAALDAMDDAVAMWAAAAGVRTLVPFDYTAPARWMWAYADSGPRPQWAREAA